MCEKSRKDKLDKLVNQIEKIIKDGDVAASLILVDKINSDSVVVVYQTFIETSWSCLRLLDESIGISKKDFNKETFESTMIMLDAIIKKSKLVNEQTTSMRDSIMEKCSNALNGIIKKQRNLIAEKNLKNGESL